MQQQALRINVALTRCIEFVNIHTLEWDVANFARVSQYVVDAQVLLGIRQLIRVIFVYLFLACKQETLNLVRTVFLP